VNYTILAMKKYGGSFVKALADALEVADPQNRLKITQTWPDEYEKYQKLGRQLFEEEKAK
jgi:hypothetical protein